MQFLILVLFIGLFMHDALAGRAATSERLPIITGIAPGLCLALILIPKALTAAAYHLLCRRAAKRLGHTGARAVLRRLDRVGAIIRNLVAVLYLLDLFLLGGLIELRQPHRLGNLVLVDELLIMLPTLAVTAWMWLAYYPVDARMRQATFMSRVDQGLPVHIWTRGQYMLSQLRHQWALMGLPLLLLTGWWEAVQKVFDGRWSEDAQAGLMLAGSLVVFVFTPMIIRRVWDTAPLPAGDLRERLMAMCRLHRVGVRELLLWRTFGGMINGAVMGLVSPLRYILLTDGLLETMPARQVEAVMAHELAHVSKHHMFWLLAVAAGSMELLRRAAELTLGWVLDGMTSGSIAARLPASVVDAMSHREAAEMGAMLLAMAGWVFIFGWVSRRFERQADTFAVQHMAREWHGDEDARRELDFGFLVNGAGKTEASGVSPAAMTPPPALPAALPNDSPATPPPLPPADELVAAIKEGNAPVAPVASIAPAIAPALPSAEPAADPSRIPPAAADVMARALQNVADLNCIPIHRNSWRHGSIAWRQKYLRSLPGKPIDDTSIDRTVQRIKWAGVVILITAVAVNVWTVVR